MSVSGAETLVSGGFATWRVSEMLACGERLGKPVVTYSTWKRSKGRNTLRDSLLRIMRVLWECELGHCCIVRDCLYNQ